MTTVPPAASVASVEKTKPCTWKRGITQSETSLGPSEYQRTIFCRGGRQVSVRQRNAFRPARRAARVQEECDVVVLRAAFVVAVYRNAVEYGAAARIQRDVDDADAETPRQPRARPARRRERAAISLRPDVLEVEAELVLGVRAVERGEGRARARRPKECGDDVGAVDERCRHAVAGLDAACGERAPSARDEACSAA